MKIFKTRIFAKWAKKASMTDGQLLVAIQEIEDGLIDGNLGGGLLKKRIGLHDKGKSRGVRTLLAFKFNELAVFIHEFEKKSG